jgi:hypothetical protein
LTKKLALFLGVLLLSFTSFHDAKADDFVAYKRHGGGHQRGDQNGNQDFRDKHNYPKKSEDQNNGNVQQPSQPSQPGSADDSKIVNAVNNKRRVDFVEGGGMVVVKLLPDDRNGLQHEKWVVRLSNGALMQAVYNLDMCEYVPLKVGDVVSMGGQFIWTNEGAMLHWLHYDPRQNRPDGYVELNGKVYCGDGQRHN